MTTFDLRFLARLGVTLAVIVLASHLGRRNPSLGGLLATMPITTLLVLFWLATDAPGDRQLLADFSFRRGFSLPVSLLAGLVAWSVAAILHQKLLR
jgi:hypothetical protein